MSACTDNDIFLGPFLTGFAARIRPSRFFTTGITDASPPILFKEHAETVDLDVFH